MISGKKLTGPDGGYGPFAVAQGFDYPVQHGFDGTGHAVAIAIDYDTLDSDLTNFAAYFGITRTGKTLPRAGRRRPKIQSQLFGRIHARRRNRGNARSRRGRLRLQFRRRVHVQRN